MKLQQDYSDRRLRGSAPCTLSIESLSVHQHTQGISLLPFTSFFYSQGRHDSPFYCGKKLSFFIWDMTAVTLQLELNDWMARWGGLRTSSSALTSSTLFPQDQAIFLCNELCLLSSGLEIKRSKASFPVPVPYLVPWCLLLLYRWSVFSKAVRRRNAKRNGTTQQLYLWGESFNQFWTIQGMFSSWWVVKFFASSTSAQLITLWSVRLAMEGEHTEQGVQPSNLPTWTAVFWFTFTTYLKSGESECKGGQKHN